jgi:TonB family protein
LLIDRWGRLGARRALSPANAYTGLYALDTFDVRNAFSVGGRLNVANIQLQDQLGSSLNETIMHFNPVIGATYKISSDVILAPLAVSGLAASASGGFDMAAIRPGRELPAFAANERSPHSTSRPWDAALSAALHVAALAALLTWATPVTETASPEPVTIEILADAPAPPVRASEGAPAPPTSRLVEPPPVAEPSPPPVAEAPPPPLVAEPSPPPVAEAPPPPPVVEPSAPPVAESPPSPPVAEPSPPPVAEAPPPPVVEPSPPPVAEKPPPKPVVEPTSRPAPPASPALPRVTKPMPTAASPATARVAKPPPPERPTPPRVAKPTPPEKISPRISREPAESSRSASRATKLASLPPQSAPAASSAEVAAYQGEVLGRIAAQKHYPEAARERAPQGVAIVRFSIAASGQLAGASLSKSAGDPLLDAEALATIRRASPFPPPPAGAPRNLSAPLSYRVR